MHYRRIQIVEFLIAIVRWIADTTGWLNVVPVAVIVVQVARARASIRGLVSWWN